MREPQVFSDREALAIKLAINKVEAVAHGNVVAVVLENAEGDLEVMFSPGQERECLAACQRIDWKSVEWTVQEYAGC